MIEVAAGIVNHNGITLRLPVMCAVGIIATNTDFYPDKSESVENIVNKVVEQAQNGELQTTDQPLVVPAKSSKKRGNARALPSPAKKRRIVRGSRV